MRKDANAQPFHGRMLGLGQTPTDASGCAPFLGAALKTPFSVLPVIEHVTWSTQLPLSQADTLETFGDTIEPMVSPKNVPGILSVDSSFAINGLLQTTMLCFGVGIHVWGEPISFTVECNSIAAASTSPIASPDVFTANDVTNEAMGTEITTPVPALLEWGFASWMAAWHMAHAYRVYWWFNQRFTLLDEMLSDMCYFGPYADAVAAGTSQVAAQQYFAQVNARYRSATIGSTSIAQPIGFRRLGSVGTDAGQTPDNHAIMRPTRDFDLVDTTFGGLRNQGGAACCSPFRKFVCPLLLEAGIPIWLQLNVIDTPHQLEMQRYLSATEGGATTPALVKFDANVNGASANLVGSNIAVEQTQDSPANFVSQSVNTDRALYKGGATQVSFQIKGLEIPNETWLSACRQGCTTGAIVNGGMTGSSGVGLMPR